MTPTFRAGFAALSLLAAPPLLAAQSPVTARVPDARPSVSREDVRAWASELQAIGARLQGATERALRGDARLRAAGDSLANEIEHDMEGVDPGLRALADRAAALTGEAQRASEVGDQERLRALMGEADRIQQRFATARAHVMRRPALVARVKAYEARLRDRLHQQEPHLDELLARGSELQGRLDQMARLQRQLAPARAQNAAPTNPNGGQAKRPD